MDLIPGPAIRARELGVGDNADSRATQSERQPTPTMGTTRVTSHYFSHTYIYVRTWQKVAYSEKIVENISNIHTAIELSLALVHRITARKQYLTYTLCILLFSLSFLREEKIREEREEKI